MSGEHAGARSTSHIRRPTGEPPGFDRVAGAFRRSGGWAIAFGIFALACALAFLGGALLGLGGTAGMSVFLHAAGFVLVLAIVPLLQGWRRLRRAAFLAALRNRWMQLARAGDPDDQIDPLRRAYAGLIGNDIRARIAASR
jgi:hypothetical protein